MTGCLLHGSYFDWCFYELFCRDLNVNAIYLSKSQIAQSCCFPLEVQLIGTRGTNVSYCHNLPESALAVSSVGVFDVCFYAHSEDYPACPKTVWIEWNELNYWGCSVGECWGRRKRERGRGRGWLRATQCLGDEERKGQDKSRNKKAADMKESRKQERGTLTKDGVRTSVWSQRQRVNERLRHPCYPLRHFSSLYSFAFICRKK